MLVFLVAAMTSDDGACDIVVVRMKMMMLMLMSYSECCSDSATEVGTNEIAAKGFTACMTVSIAVTTDVSLNPK